MVPLQNHLPACRPWTSVSYEGVIKWSYRHCPVVASILFYFFLAPRDPSRHAHTGTKGFAQTLRPYPRNRHVEGCIGLTTSIRPKQWSNVGTEITYGVCVVTGLRGSGREQGTRVCYGPTGRGTRVCVCGTRCVLPYGGAQ
eukprot:4817010-Prymnesium_polylepis.1